MDLQLPGTELESEEGPNLQPRRSRRVVLQEATQLRSNDQQLVEVQVRDLSTSGFMAECMRPVLIGSYVSLDLPGIGPVHAQVRWQVGGRLGGKFLDPISLHRCEWLASRP
ncbi:MAG TPA: PilZ domain-containing protein [Allosphingosinicella sp.]|jgi:hypothetical protein